MQHDGWREIRISAYRKLPELFICGGRKKYIQNGGDGIYAAWKTVNNEPCFKDSNIGWGDVPIAEELQKNIMQFTTNQKNKFERNNQFTALIKTLNYFK